MAVRQMKRDNGLNITTKQGERWGRKSGSQAKRGGMNGEDVEIASRKMAIVLYVDQNC